MLSKKTHTKTLLLAACYNMYGEYYYRLCGQGGPGEGDKDTFALAAIALNDLLCTVAKPPNSLGPGGAPAEVLQHDPIAVLKCGSDESCLATVRPFFIHCGFPPKLNALESKRHTRQFGGEALSMELFREDLEPIVLGYMVDMACDEGLDFQNWWKGNKSSTPVCEQTRGCFRNIFGREYVTTQGQCGG